jgi:hypothetical protein
VSLPGTPVIADLPLIGAFWRRATQLDHWWFGKGSPVTLGVFRILISTVAFVNLAMISIDFDAWFTEHGYVPLRVVPLYLGDPPRLNLLWGVTDPNVTRAFYFATMAAALLTGMGLWTRISSIALALGYISLQHRNPMILHGGDVVLRLGVMYLALAPVGAACSLDRVIALWRGKAPAVPVEISLWVQRLLQYEVALIYFTTVWHKWKGHFWRDGTAVWYPFNLNEFDRFWLPSFLQDNLFAIKAATYGTLLIELSLATLVFYRPFRKWVLLAGLGLHAFIEYAFNIPLFAVTITSFYIAFYDGKEISDWARRVGERLARFRLTVTCPAGFQFRPHAAASLAALSPFGLAQYANPETSASDSSAEQGERSWSAQLGSGERRDPCWGSLARSGAAWPLLAVPWIWRRVLERAIEPRLSATQEQGSLHSEPILGGSK